MCLSRQIISSGRPVERPHDKVDREQPIAIDRARSFHVARWSLEIGTSVPVAPMWTRATGRELVAIDRARFGKVSCGHSLIHPCHVDIRPTMCVARRFRLPMCLFISAEVGLLCKQVFLDLGKTNIGALLGII